MNVGEQLVADYLQHVKKCQFVGQNLPTSGEQGEIDVVGIDIVKKRDQQKSVSNLFVTSF